jgi:hypothetical protein
MTRTHQMTRIGEIEGDAEPVPGKCVDCRAPLEIAPLTIHLAQQFSQALRRRGEAPLDTGSVARCPDCDAAFQAGKRSEGQRRMERDKVLCGQMREFTRRAKAGELVQAEADTFIRELPQGFARECSDMVTSWRSRLSHIAQKAASKGDWSTK